MGVYIKGMEMPTEEYGPMTIKVYPNGHVAEYIGDMGRVWDAVPVPPHGRLKEEEWLKKIISRAIEINASIEPRSEAVEQEQRCLWWFEQQIGIAPTIIEAEEGE